MLIGRKFECSVPVMVMMGPPRLSRPPRREGGGRRTVKGEGEKGKETEKGGRK